tara:strand:- start:1338 stop:2720 length:1383 start_codon:yes stop_codon:yes gene_type:complete
VVTVLRGEEGAVVTYQALLREPPGGTLEWRLPLEADLAAARTLPGTVFEHVDRATAPRVTHLVERDPCERDEGDGAPEDGEGGAADEAPGDGEGGAADEASGDGEGGAADEASGDAEGGAADEASGDAEGGAADEASESAASAAEPVQPTFARSGFDVTAGDEGLVATLATSALIPAGEGRWATPPLRIPMGPLAEVPLAFGGEVDLLLVVLDRARVALVDRPTWAAPTGAETNEDGLAAFGERYEAAADEVLGEGSRVLLEAVETLGADPLLSDRVLATLGGDVVELPEPVVVTRLRLRAGSSLALERVAPVYRPEWSLERAPVAAHEVDPVAATGVAMNRFRAEELVFRPWDGEAACEGPVRDRWRLDEEGAARWPVRALGPVAAGIESARRERNQVARTVEAEQREQRERREREAAAREEAGCGCSAPGDGVPAGALIVLLLFGRRRQLGSKPSQAP